MDKNLCFGCHQCVDACPYGARQFNYKDPLENPAYGIADQYIKPEEILTLFEIRNAHKHPFHRAEKCIFCDERRAKGELPACVETCPTTARFFGRLDDPESDFNVAKARLEAEKSVIPDMPADKNHVNYNTDTQPSFYVSAKYQDNYKF